MKRLFTVLLMLVALVASAGDRSVKFSRHSPTLKLVSFDEKNSVGIFEGNLRTTGTLFFAFDQDQHGKVVDVLYAKFVPDEPSVLPAVSSGFYPGAVHYVSLEPAEKILNAAFGENAMKRFLGTDNHVASVEVEVTFRKYNTSVECDSRQYYSSAVTVRPLPNQMTALTEAPRGC